ncbi:MAG TPA: ABC transporter permease subunit [Sporichthyaceae bacterium]|nr:ABC transporter permease subunit [Sporichthyaceae bacterium]
MSWAWDNRGFLGRMCGEHLYLALVPLLIGFLLAVPLGLFLARARWGRPAVLGFCVVLEAIPVLSWFVFLPAIIDTTVPEKINVLVGLTLLVFAMMTQSISAAVAAVPDELRATAEGLGFTTLRRAFQVDLPVAMPVVIGGLRTAAVSCISLATLAALIGVGGLGKVITEGYSTGSEPEVLSAIAAVVVLAVAAENLLVRAQRYFLPWSTLAPVR